MHYPLHRPILLSARDRAEHFAPGGWKRNAYAGTLSLAKELTSVPVTSMQIGDVLIQGGSPGHAVIVVDMAENPATGEKLYLLAQSYMPAQDIQVLVNLKERDKSPWYTLKGEGSILTPEWGFTSVNLKRFKE